MLPTLSKILERVLYNQIQSHIVRYDILCTHQSGFHSGYSTQDVLLHVTDKWLKAIDEGKYSGAVFLDLAKAFDTVNHSILCTKLSYYGLESHHLTCYAAIYLIVSSEFCFVVSSLSGVLFLLVYPRDPFWVLCFLLLY